MRLLVCVTVVVHLQRVVSGQTHRFLCTCGRCEMWRHIFRRWQLAVWWTQHLHTLHFCKLSAGCVFLVHKCSVPISGQDIGAPTPQPPPLTSILNRRHLSSHVWHGLHSWLFLCLGPICKTLKEFITSGKANCSVYIFQLSALNEMILLTRNSYSILNNEII